MSAAVVRLPVLSDAEAPSRPVTRGDCADGPRPCPWVSCSHHAIHGVLLGEAGRDIAEDQVVEAIEAMSASCTLDVADEGGATLEAVAEPWGVTRERIRQLEARALKRVKPRSLGLAADLSEDELPASVPAPKRVAAPRIDWMGEGDDPAVTDTAPAAMGAEEFDVQVERREGVSATGVIAAAHGAVCSVPGCGSAPQGYRETLDLALRSLCSRHRLAASSLRAKKRCGTTEAVAIVLARAGGDLGPVVAGEAPVPAPTAEIASLREERDRAVAALEEQQTAAASLCDERDWLLSQRDAERVTVATLRADRDELAQKLRVAVDRIEEMEGQLLAEARAPAAAPAPLARLAALAAVLVPVDAGDRIAWTIGSTRDGDGLWCASALGCDEAGVSGWEATGDTPDEALAALVRHVEGEARARIEALTAALALGWDGR